MITENLDRETVRAAVGLACRAPSVHNSQPWRWRLGDRSVHLYADLRRWLPATDADGRDLVVSCGAALHHLRVALAAEGLRATVHRLPDPANADHLAAVELRPGGSADADLALAAAIVRRRTDRRPFAAWPVPDATLEALVAAAAEHGAHLRVLTDDADLDRLAAAIREAARIQDRTPGYETELALWSGRHASADGIPAANLPARARSGGTGRRFAPGDLPPGRDRADGAVLAVLGTASDDPLSQLRAGEALSAVLLLATELGLATCPLSQPLEVGSTRRCLRDDVLGGSVVPQLVLRVGWAPTGEGPPATPRRPVEDAVEPLDRGGR